MVRKLDFYLKISSKKVVDLIKVYFNKIKLYFIYKLSKLRGKKGRFFDEKQENVIVDMCKCDKIV